MTTLISMIGKGKVEKQQLKGYEKVAYSFENGPTVTTSCSTNAILKSGLYSIDKVIIIGTKTSAWAELLDDPSPAEEKVFFQLFDDCERECPFNVKSELAQDLRNLLEARWRVQRVSFVATEAELTSQTAADIYGEYVEKCLGTEQKYILDVTHGLRWMPMFLTSAIRYKEMVEHGLDSMRLLYAEIGNNSKGFIRELDALWNGQKTAEAMSLFFDKFDSTMLVPRIPAECCHLKEAMENFGNCMQANYLMPLVWDRDDKLGGDYPLGQTVKQLRNGITEVGRLPQPPNWLEAVASEMFQWVERLRQYAYPSERLLVLADMYAERGLWGQAVIALDVALSIFACEYFQPGQYPDWEMTRSNLEMLKKSMKQSTGGLFHSLDKAVVDHVINLTHIRNMIAHGNLNSAHDKNKTQKKPNLSKDYKIFQAALVSLFSYRN
ncbi:MAG: CRISPR-associated DxTHG motif protein [Victivallales bacterium]|nr:CRISPR-associated DxTHG motif protein [Victivallales bacterium]